ncbi:MAG: HlyD family efflux transporter periplasmic adaptor subunit [Fuerstiella sp.]
MILSRTGLSRQLQTCRAAMMAMAVISMAGQMLPLAAQENPIHVPQVTISLLHEADIAARETGMLSQVPVSRGMTVRAGDVIAELDREREELAVRAALLNLKVAELQANNDSALQTARAQLQEAMSGRRVKEIALQIAQTEAETDIPVQIAGVETRLRRMELERAEGARSSFKGSISESQIDRLKTAVEKGTLEIQQAENSYRVQQLKAKGEQFGIEQKDDEVLRYEALVNQEEKNLMIAGVSSEIRRNEVDAARLNLSRRTMRAPFDGVIVDVSVTPGEWIEQGSPVARIIDLSTLSAEGFLPAENRSLDLQGRRVTIQVTVEGEPRQLSGTVTFVSPEVDPVNQQVRFRAEFDNPSMKVLPGMNGSLTIAGPDAEPNAASDRAP